MRAQHSGRRPTHSTRLRTRSARTKARQRAPASRARSPWASFSCPFASRSAIVSASPLPGQLLERRPGRRHLHDEIVRPCALDPQGGDRLVQRGDRLGQLGRQRVSAGRLAGALASSLVQLRIRFAERICQRLTLPGQLIERRFGRCHLHDEIAGPFAFHLQGGADSASSEDSASARAASRARSARTSFNLRIRFAERDCQRVALPGQLIERRFGRGHLREEIAGPFALHIQGVSQTRTARKKARQHVPPRGRARRGPRQAAPVASRSAIASESPCPVSCSSVDWSRPSPRGGRWTVARSPLRAATDSASSEESASARADSRGALGWRPRPVGHVASRSADCQAHHLPRSATPVPRPSGRSVR